MATRQNIQVSDNRSPKIGGNYLDKKKQEKKNTIASVYSLSDEVDFYDDKALRNENVEDLTRYVLSRLQEGTDGWWLHVDLDVLSTNSLPAVDYPQPEG